MTKQLFEKFLAAQEKDYAIALTEIKNGRKESHWMWYIFPQIQGLGLSETSKFYAIKDVAEAKAYLQHDILGKRLIHLCKELLLLKTSNAGKVFGSPDDIKLKSSMTLFAALPKTDPVFSQVLDKFFGSLKDTKTLLLMGI